MHLTCTSLRQSPTFGASCGVSPPSHALDSLLVGSIPKRLMSANRSGTAFFSRVANPSFNPEKVLVMLSEAFKAFRIFRCDRPRGIPRNVMDGIIANVVDCRLTPVGLQQYIRAQTGTSLHITYVRKIMHLYNLSPKMTQRIHINRAGRKAAWNRRYRLKQRILCLERDGFAVIMQDEAFFVHDTVSGRKYWSPKGRRINVPYTGSHRKVTVYG